MQRNGRIAYSKRTASLGALVTQRKGQDRDQTMAAVQKAAQPAAGESLLGGGQPKAHTGEDLNVRSVQGSSEWAHHDITAYSSLSGRLSLASISPNMYLDYVDSFSCGLFLSF